MSEEEEQGVEYLAGRLERAEVELKHYRAQFERIEKLCHDSTDTYYTIKIIQNMVKETNRLAHQKEFL